ncbi:MAG: acyl-ACP--UDP-N-acetylglucosamine O-acyltransferase [Thermoguttaceae bacterium]
MSIHPQAIVSPSAKIGSNVKIGPFCVVESGASVGADCILENRVVIKSGTTLGAKNRVFEGAVLGGLPQHARIPERPGKLIIGSGNTIRENVTIHRALDENRQTRIGENCLIMVNAHVAHDCQIGNEVIVTNNAMLAGHITIGDRAYISGAVGVHQFCRIGTLAMVGGQAHINQDVPPFVTVDGLSSLVVGLNQIGLRRAGYDLAKVQQIKKAYRLIYRSGARWQEIIETLRTDFAYGPAALFYDFLSTTKRGILSERRMPPNATLKIHSDQSEEKLPHFKVKAVG